MGSFVSQAILLASFHLLLGENSSQFVFNLESVVKNYVDDYAAKRQTTAWFYDMWAQHPQLQERGVYKRYQVRVTASNFEFGEAIGEHTRPTEVFTTTYTNEQKTDAIHTVKQTYLNTEFSTIKLERGFESKYKTSINVGVPGIVSAGGGFSFDYTLNKTTSDTKSKTETLSIELQVAVPSKKTVQVTWYVTNKVVDFPWTATVYVRGWFAFWLNHPVNNHRLWFFPVSVLANIDKNLTVVDSLTVTFEASGFFRKIATLDSRVFVYELRRFERTKPTTTRRPKPLRMPPVLE
ncbi:uncharacterized protein LOC115325933 [Ixodes scapularis]|uniref:uncharacterized protein LOC115325933 n=1 Tax=Ixodes scapularis TaxID=6945 RepID=UPI001C38120C|nr:uncharacterized protein LOC115325933 [Ixodes scapularis]